MNKGLDGTFMHYGIRNEDMRIIQDICEKNEINFDWFKENILREYHNLKMKNEEIDVKTLHRLLENALTKNK